MGLSLLHDCILALAADKTGSAIIAICRVQHRLLYSYMMSRLARVNDKSWQCVLNFVDVMEGFSCLHVTYIYMDV